MARVMLAAALLVPALLQAGDPDPVLVRATLPTGAEAILKLQFKKGLSVSGKSLPPGFLKRGVLASGWVDFADLNGDGKRWALLSLFPGDAWSDGEVAHAVRYPELESVWLMSALFTGHGQNYDKLMAANPDLPEKLREGDTWRIPRNLLLSELGGEGNGRPDRTQPEDELDDEARTNAYRAMLSFEKDGQGGYAAYRMRKGEALYSSVVMRYSDRVDPKEVNELADRIAKRSGIADVRGIQPGQLVKIPLEALSDPFQPEGTKALADEQEVREEVRRTTRLEAGPKLKGVRVILDAGHGGRDKGAMASGIWESDFVYDIEVRVLRLLQQDTDAQVSSTILYPDLGFKSREAIRRPSDEAVIQTTPPFPIDGESPTAVSVHLRWILANDQLQAFAKKGDAQKTLFVSFHADSLHPSARGTMVYVPGAASIPARFQLGGNRAARVKEFKRASLFRLSAREKLQSEARSRQFAELLLRSLAKERIPIHKDRAIRNVIHRDGKTFVPAAIRFNEAATKVLVEVANLTNEDDAGNLKDPDFRERYAVAVTNAIRAYFKR